VPLHMERFAAARRALGRFRQEPCIDERRGDDSEDEQPREEPEEHRGVAHCYNRPSTASQRSTNARFPTMRSMTTSVPA
jgi:hypothetical protein